MNLQEAFAYTTVMLASELAQEMEIDPSLMSKRLGIYFGELGKERTRLLDGQVVGHMRHAHELLETGQSRTFKTAVQMILGTYVEAVPPESVRLLESRLAQIENVQAQTLDSVNRILQLIEGATTPHDSHGQQPGQ